MGLTTNSNDLHENDREYFFSKLKKNEKGRYSASLTVYVLSAGAAETVCAGSECPLSTCSHSETRCRVLIPGHSPALALVATAPGDM